MKKFLVLFALFLAGCQLTPTPNDFPSPPTTIMNMPPPTIAIELPTPSIVVPTFEPRLIQITHEKMTDADAFFQVFYDNVVSANRDGIAKAIHYPIQVNINGALKTISSQGEFLENYDAIFNQDMLYKLNKNSTGNLVLLPDGIRVGYGEIWFNLFCTDSACIESRFLITQINN